MKTEPQASQQPPEIPSENREGTTKKGTGERYLTCAEVAELLGVKSRTVEQWVEERRIPFYHVGRAVRLLYTEVQTYLAQNCRCEAEQPLKCEPHVPSRRET